MRKNTPSSADDGDAADDSSESFDGAQIEAIASSAPGSTRGWTQRLSLLGKLARALVAALHRELLQRWPVGAGRRPSSQGGSVSRSVGFRG
jgi:hypothetical protein